MEGIDFRSFKVVDEQRSDMTLHNNGKYEVGYKVLLRKRPVRDVLSFTPPEGTLAPGATQKLEVVLKTPEELDLTLNTDVRVQFTELLTNETLQDLAMPVKVSCHAVFSQACDLHYPDYPTLLVWSIDGQ